MQRNVPLGTCWTRADTHCFCVAPSSMEQDHFQKSAFSPQLLGSYVQIDCLWPTLFLSEVVLFSLEIQAISACLHLRTCPFRIFHRLASSFPCLIYKKDLSLQHLACPTCEPSLQADPKGGDSAICGLQLQAQVRFRHVSHLEMIWDDRRPWEIWTFQIQHLKCLQDDWFKSLRVICNWFKYETTVEFGFRPFFVEMLWKRWFLLYVWIVGPRGTQSILIEALWCGQTMTCFSQKSSGHLGAICDFEIADATHLV